MPKENKNIHKEEILRPKGCHLAHSVEKVRNRKWGDAMGYMLGLLLFIPSLGLAQTNVGGTAPISFNTAPTACGGNCTRVSVFVDITGLQGNADLAGLNAFVLAFDLDRGNVLAYVEPGLFPNQDWNFFSTNRDLVDAANRLVLLGAVGDVDAPNQLYHVANVVLCGTDGPVTLTFVPGESSLGSRVVNGDGPGPIAIAPPAPFQTSILVDFPLTFLDGVDVWRQASIDYDLVDPMGNIDALDLAQLVNCRAP